jgi:transcriptional antiterminator RfaH
MSLNGSPSLPWFVVRTKLRAEDRAANALGERDVTTFLPRLLVQRRHGSRRWQALEPLFPGYLFAQFHPEPDIISRVRWTPGVSCLLGDDAGPLSVAEEIVLHLKERVGEQGYVVVRPTFVPGTRVRFKSGPFAMLEGIIERPAPRAERVRVLLTLMNATAAAEADVADLERI